MLGFPKNPSLDIKFHLLQKKLSFIVNILSVGLGVTFSPQDPRFVGSNPAEVNGFFQDVKILSTSPPGGTLS